MMIMQRTFDDDNNRSLNYTKIDQCQDNISIDNDEYYRQILHLNEHFNYENEIKIKVISANRFHLVLFIFLILTSQTNALPLYQTIPTSIKFNQYQNPSFIQQSSPFPVAMVQLADRSLNPHQPYKVYRRLPTSVQRQAQQQQQVQIQNKVLSYPNGAGMKIFDQTNLIHQASAPSRVTIQHPHEHQLSLQAKRERQRRTMIDRMVSLFDEDGNGHLERDELYSMALRSNMFPRFHHYLKQTPI